MKIPCLAAASLWLLAAPLVANAATVVYSSDFQSDRSEDFHLAPTSLRHDPDASHPPAADGAMVFGAPGESWVRAALRVPVSAGETYEVVSRWTTTGSGSNIAERYLTLTDAEGETLWSDVTRSSGSEQVLLPADGVTPTGAAWLEISWLIRGTIAEDTTRRVEIYQLQITELGPEGPRPFKVRQPYIDRILGFVGVPVTIDLTDCFQGMVTDYSAGTALPLAVNGQTITLTPVEPRPLDPPMIVYALNDAGQSVEGVKVYLQVEPTPAPLAPRQPDAVSEAQLIHQFVEPGQVMFPVNGDKLFTDGLPPFDDRVVSKPDWVEMPVDGLLGGRCPDGAAPASTSIVVERTDARGDTATYTLGVDVIAPRSRVPTHHPIDETELRAALNQGGNVVQLQPGTVYRNIGNPYGMGLGGTSTEHPVIVLGAEGAVINTLRFNQSGHYIFENVTLELASEMEVVLAKRVWGLRLVNCRLKGIEVPVDLEDGTAWMTPDTYRYGGSGVSVRDGSYVVLDGCQISQVNTALAASTGTNSFGVYRTVSDTVADDHCFFQQSGAIWMEEVDLLGHEGNHTAGEHRDIIQLANPNQPPDRKVLLRRVFGYGNGQSQALFIENEDQRIAASRLPYWIGNHRDVLVEHSVFVGNSAHGISLRGILDYEIRNCLTLGHPDEVYGGSGSTPAYGQIFVRGVNQDGVISRNIADRLSIENPAETSHTNNVLTDNLILGDLQGGYDANRDAIFPYLRDTGRPMKERLTMGTDWAAEHPNIGPDILRSSPLQPVINGWQLEATHGPAGLLATPLDPGTVESRTGAPVAFRITASETLAASSVSPASVTLIGDTTGNQAAKIAGVSLEGGTAIVVELSEPLPTADRYTLTVAETVISASGIPLSGDRSRHFGVLVGDVDGSGSVTAADVAALRAAAGQAVDGTTSQYDVDRSGEITGADMRTAEHALGQALP